MKNLTIVIPYRDEADALAALLATMPGDLPVIVVDDCSTRPPKPTSRATVLRLSERGYFSGAVNAGIEACDTDVLVLNQDTRFEGSEWLQELDVLRRRFAIIGDGVMDHPAWPKGYVQGTLMFLRRDAIKRVGLLDRVRWPLWGATAEWQLRACRAGFLAHPIADMKWVKHDRRGGYGAAIKRTLQQQPSKRGLLIRTPPLVSVCTACHNYGRYLPDLVASLIGGPSSLGDQPGQTFQGFELVICDDASTDDSPAIASRLSDPWKGVRVVLRRTRGGTAVAMNDAVRASHGKWLMMVDADDMLEPDALDTLLRVVEANEYAVPYTDLRLFANGKRGVVQPTREYSFDKLLEANMVPAGVMVSRTGFEAAGGYPAAFTDGRQDWALAVALGRVGYCGQRVDQPLYLYRREGQNRTLQNTNPADRARFMTRMVATFPDLYKGERPMGCCGGGSRRAQAIAVAAAIPTAKSVSVLGAPGMVLLEYVGTNVGRTSWRGVETGARYSFSGRERVKQVDVRDAPGLLELVYDRKKAFRVYKAPAPVEAPPKPKLEPIEVQVVSEPPVVDGTEPAPEPVVTPKKTSHKKRVVVPAEDDSNA